MKHPLNIALFGPPGTGKTTTASLFSQFFYGIGLTSHHDLSRPLNRSDFIAEYEGKTTRQTQRVMLDLLGKVGFLDEAYQLVGANPEKALFGREALNVITQFLSEHESEFIMIVAGYEKEMKKDFFDVNPGLWRRFPHKITLQAFTTEDYMELFKRALAKQGARITVNGFMLLKRLLQTALDQDASTFQGWFFLFIHLCRYRLVYCVMNGGYL